MIVLAPKWGAGGSILRSKIHKKTGQIPERILAPSWDGFCIDFGSIFEHILDENWPLGGKAAPYENIGASGSD